MNADPIIVETTRRIFQDLGDPQTINNTDNTKWRVPLWNALVKAGLTLAWCSEESGGAGASMADGFAIQRVVGEFATPIPLAETLLAGWLLDQARIKAPPGPMTVVPVNDRSHINLTDAGILNGIVERVPFARETEHLVALSNSSDGPKIAMVQRVACGIAPGQNLAGEPRDRVSFNAVKPIHMSSPSTPFNPIRLKLMGAVMRTVQMTGAIETMLNMCIAYTQERVAFGRPIAKFQVIQHNLAVMGGEFAAALAATGAAEGAIMRDPSFGDKVVMNVASAKIRVGEAANEASAIAHQLHGAIGFTQEHILHRFSHRLWSWRDEYDSEANWAVLLGKAVAARGPDEMWPNITAA